MKLGITGLPGAGKSTIFEALTENVQNTDYRKEDRISTVHVSDERVDILSRFFVPEKTIYAQVEYLLPGIAAQKNEKTTDNNVLTKVRDCNALVHVVRNFSRYGFEKPSPYNDFKKFELELIFSDLVVAEKRLERVEQEKKRNRKIDDKEIILLNRCIKNLEDEIPLRNTPDLAFAHQLKGFAFLSAKPMLVLFNNEDEDNLIPDVNDKFFNENCMVIRGKLEQELCQMSDEDTADFLNEFNIADLAANRVVEKSYELLGLISFFTVGNDEVRAWPVRKNTKAVDAAGEIHSDIKKGFIRAEVISFKDLMDAGSYAAARKEGTIRLEGKTYKVQDGDIISFRFNV